MVFAIIGIARSYLLKDKTRTMVQRRGGSDDCEHEFAGIKVRNQKPTQGDARAHVAKRTGTRSSCFTSINRSNTRGDSSMYTEELIEPRRKKTKLRYRFQDVQGRIHDNQFN